MALLHIDQWPTPIETRRLRVLEAALDAGVPFPHGCGTGERGSCKTQLLRGQVTLDRYSPEALSDAERREGVTLACRARLVTDVHVRWLSSAPAPLPMVKLRTRMSCMGHVAHDVVVIRLALPESSRFDFYPGQFVKFQFAKLPVRSYSMASQPNGSELEFHSRLAPSGAVGDYMANPLQTGESVEVRGPFGEAYWDESHSARRSQLLLMAGGTGTAPILPVLDAALKNGMPPEQIHVYHGVRGKRDLYAGERLAARAGESGFSFVPVYSIGRVDHAGQGLVREAVAKDFSSLAGARIYVAGPPPMVDAVVDMATRRGADTAQIRADAFYAAAPAKKGLWERITGFSGMPNWGAYKPQKRAGRAKKKAA